MSDFSVAMAKLAALIKAIGALLNERVGYANPPKIARRQFEPDEVGQYFGAAAAQLAVLRGTASDLFADFHELRLEPQLEVVGTRDHPENRKVYGRGQLEQLKRDME